MDVDCIGKGFLLSRTGAERICEALMCLKDKISRESAKQRTNFPFDIKSSRELQCESLINCFFTMLTSGTLEVMPAKKYTPLWTKQDEIIERQNQALRKIAYNIGCLRTLLAGVKGLENIPAVREIEDECAKGLDARRAVLAQTISDDETLDSSVDAALTKKQDTEKK